ncbi:MAG: YdcH family protein [Pseudomonadota bacterium]
MSQGRVLQLTRKHQDLEEKIRQATLSPSTDDLAVRAMKREKLRLKEMIAAAG